jgi:hypothetical protein
VAVHEENTHVSIVINTIRECIKHDQAKLLDFMTTLVPLSLMGKIDVKQFSNTETPKYLRGVIAPTD